MGREEISSEFDLRCFVTFLAEVRMDGNHFAGNIFFTVVVLPVRTFSLHLFG